MSTNLETMPEDYFLERNDLKNQFAIEYYFATFMVSSSPLLLKDKMDYYFPKQEITFEEAARKEEKKYTNLKKAILVVLNDTPKSQVLSLLQEGTITRSDYFEASFIARKAEWVEGHLFPCLGDSYRTVIEWLKTFQGEADPHSSPLTNAKVNLTFHEALGTLNQKENGLLTVFDFCEMFGVPLDLKKKGLIISIASYKALLDRLHKLDVKNHLYIAGGWYLFNDNDVAMVESKIQEVKDITHYTDSIDIFGTLTMMFISGDITQRELLISQIILEVSCCFDLGALPPTLLRAELQEYFGGFKKWKVRKKEPLVKSIKWSTSRSIVRKTLKSIWCFYREFMNKISSISWIAKAIKPA